MIKVTYSKVKVTKVTQLKLLCIYIPSNFADVTHSMFSKTGRLEWQVLALGL